MDGVQVPQVPQVPLRGGSLLFTTKYHYFYQVFPICLQNPFIMGISKKSHAEWETNVICKLKKNFKTLWLLFLDGVQLPQG